MFVKAEDDSYELKIPCFSATTTNALAWVESALGPSVLALLTHYQDRANEILNQTFYVANAKMTYPELAAVLSKGSYSFHLKTLPLILSLRVAIDKPVKFVSLPTSGMKPVDDMV